MKVGDTGDKGASGVAATRAVGDEQAKTKGSASTKTQRSGGDGKGATVTLSSAVSSLMASESDSGDIDAAKVAAVRQSISDGSYKINHDSIADKLIANAKELLSPRSH